MPTLVNAHVVITTIVTVDEVEFYNHFGSNSRCGKIYMVATVNVVRFMFCSNSVFI